MTTIALWCFGCGAGPFEMAQSWAHPGNRIDHVPVGISAKARLRNDGWELHLRRADENGNYAWVLLCGGCIAKEQAFALTRPTDAQPFPLESGYCWDDPASRNMSANWTFIESYSTGFTPPRMMPIGENFERHAKNSHPCGDCVSSPACRECDRVLIPRGNSR
jgi:hypothetical protein